MTKIRYLTKSRFKLAYECPAKLFYNEQPTVYGNKNSENDFLEALAHGGFQVGALAKLYYPDGIDLEDLGTDNAIKKTEELLQKTNVTIFEAAIQTGPFLVRVDVLEKKGQDVSLIEVKSKSYDSSGARDFFKKRDLGIDSDWDPYIVDISFQTWVAKEAHPKWSVSSFLLLPDKAVTASIDGIHQHFRLFSPDQKRTKVTTSPGISADQLGNRLLHLVNVDREVDYILTKETFPTGGPLPEFAHYLAKHHQEQTRALMRISSLCKPCEFRIPDSMKIDGKKSAFEECWILSNKLKPQDIGRPLIFDIWNCKSEDLLSKGKIFMDQVLEEDLKPKEKPKKARALERYQRQWIQVDKARRNDQTPYVDKDGLKDLFASIRYPIHCIDFETTMVAIPFHKGRRPYEQIAFQFSHHVLDADGRVSHVDQYLDMRPGIFPNFDFLRRLKQSISKDQGTIFRYATHENTVLRQIRDQLISTPQSDQDELIAFIDSITKPRRGEDGEPGSRNMIDLREVVLDHFYHPLMGGSNSIKKVIPAVLEESRFLQAKYSKPIYGKECEIESLNFDKTTWIEMGSDGHVRDPYKLLPPVFSDFSQETFNGEMKIFQDESIDDGGAAMTAWGRMQFTEMSETERAAIQAALLKYCELDTLSMVWLLESFIESVRPR